MARELLAIPGTTVPSERVNSEAREMLPYTRSRLGPKKIECSTIIYLLLVGASIENQEYPKARHGLKNLNNYIVSRYFITYLIQLLFFICKN